MKKINNNNNTEHIKQVSTEGVLNFVNERYGCNQKRRTVPIQNLIRYHKPKQQAELIALIASHREGELHSKCPCGCKSAGTIQDFADNLYKAYLKYREGTPEAPYKNEEDAYIFMKSLFVSNSLKGNAMEDMYVKLINNYFNSEGMKYTCSIAPSMYDFKYAIDLIIVDSNNIEIGFIQVKPISYKNYNDSHPIVKMNISKNKLFNKPVVYVYYDKDLNITESIEKSINKISLK